MLRGTFPPLRLRQRLRHGNSVECDEAMEARRAGGGGEHKHEAEHVPGRRPPPHPPSPEKLAPLPIVPPALPPPHAGVRATAAHAAL